MGVPNPELLTKILESKANEAIAKLPTIPVESEEFARCLNNYGTCINIIARISLADNQIKDGQKTEEKENQNGTNN